MVTHSIPCILVWRISWTEEPCGHQSIGSQTGCNLACTHTRRGSNSKGTPQILDIRHRFIPLFLEIFCETSTSCCEDGASLVKCFLYLLSFWSFTPLSLNFPPSGLYSQGICYLRICLKYTWASTPSGFRFGTMGSMEWCRLFRRKWV